jgi:glycosyltransferase involved in cell wall biosynthesis
VTRRNCSAHRADEVACSLYCPDGSNEDTDVRPNLLCIGGEDHFLRIPFFLALRDKGFRISAAGTGDPTPFGRAGLDYHPFHFSRFVDPLTDWTAFRAIAKLIAEVRPAVVQCFDTKLNLLVPFAARGLGNVKVISTINGLGWLYSSSSPMALGLRPVYRALQRLANRWTAVTVFQNRDDQAFFMRHRMVGRGENVVIPGSGIDVEKFEPGATGLRSPELRETLAPGASEVVITVTRMTRQKGIPTLLEAAALVHQRRPSVRFLLVGPRESERPFAVTQAEIERHAPYVLALGPRSDVPALLGLADVFAFPTEYFEGVPRALLEAAVAGCPIVTTSMPGCTDVIRDGWNGFLVPPRRPQLLAERILDLVGDRVTAAAMGARAAKLVRTEFSLEITVARYAALYEDLVKRRSQMQMLKHPRESEPHAQHAAPCGDLGQERGSGSCRAGM